MRRMPERMPPARDHDDPRAPVGHEPPYGAGLDAPGLETPGLDTPGLDTPPPLRSPGTRPAAPLRSPGHPSIRPSQAPDYSGQRSTSDRRDYRPSPAAPRRLRERPWLDIDGDRYPLLGAITVIGRDDDADIVLDDPGVSRRHSEIRITYDGPHQVITIRDLGSTNGTYVNGDLVTSVHLADGDRLTIGRTHLLLHEGGVR
jgi:hypothetical protein